MREKNSMPKILIKSCHKSPTHKMVRTHGANRRREKAKKTFDTISILTRSRGRPRSR